MARSPNTVNLYPNGATIVDETGASLEWQRIEASFYGSFVDPGLNFMEFEPLGQNGKFIYDGYHFLHWNTAADDSGTIYNVGDIIPQVDFINYYAIWEEDSASSDTILTTTYGSITNNITSYGTFTLNTKGKFCQNDIVLSFNEESQVDLISFSLTSSQTSLIVATYQAENGMTWGDWINSQYNVDNFYINSIYVYSNEGYEIVDYEEGTLMRSTDNIIDNYPYYSIYDSGGPI